MADIILAGSTSGAITISAPAVSGTNTLTLPVATDTLVGKATTDTLTNKSIVASQLTGTVAAARLPAGSVLQVVSTTKTSIYSVTTTATPTAITGLSVSITPASASNKILVFGQVTGSVSATTYGYSYYIYKDASVLTGATGDAANSQGRATSSIYTSYVASSQTVPFTYLDSPATTSAITYAIYSTHENPGGATFYVNRSANATIHGGSTNDISTITVMEIQG